MMTKLFTIAAISFTFLFNAQTTELKSTVLPVIIASELSEISFSTLVVDKKEMAYDSKDLFEFEFTNTGEFPLIISKVQTSCGCTQLPNNYSTPIAPGQISKLAFSYATTRVGEFSKSITVTSNGSLEPLLLTIKGIVLPAPIMTEPVSIIK